MAYRKINSADAPTIEKEGVNMKIYGPLNGQMACVRQETTTGHVSEFYNKVSSFIYIILEGHGVYVLDGEPIEVKGGDVLVIEPNTKIFYVGNLKQVLITNPAWKPENEVIVRTVPEGEFKALRAKHNL